MLEILQTIPVLRIFDEAKAREFYCGWLGCKVEFEHRFEPTAPLYMSVTLQGFNLHLSEHHGDGTPGGHVFIRCKNLRAWNAELLAKQYNYNRPGIEDAFWGGICMTLTDPFCNKLIFSEQDAA